MNINLSRIKFSAEATFTPAAPGTLNDQRMGIDAFSQDYPQTDLVHTVRLEVTNFGASGNSITINASSFVVTLGGTAAATVTRGAGLDFDGVSINADFLDCVALRIVSAPDTETVRLSSADYELKASTASSTVSAIFGDGPIAGSGTITLIGPTGVQSPPYVLEILFVGKL